jgi:hypothetical protein
MTNERRRLYMGGNKISLFEAQKLVKKPLGIEEVKLQNYTTQDIINLVLEVDNYNKINHFAKELAQKLKGDTTEQTLKNVYEFVQNNIQYLADAFGYERVKNVPSIIHEGFADCKGMSLLTGAILRELNIPYFFRFAGYGMFNKKITHVYIIAFNGVEYRTLDCVIKQGYGQEVRFSINQDYYVTENMPSIGIIQESDNKVLKGLGWLVAGFIGYKIFKD